jgi:hypothetical protein
VGLGWVCDGACGAGSRAQSSGAAAAARLMCCATHAAPAPAACDSALARCVSDTRCSEQWLIFRYAPYRSSAVNCIALFHSVCVGRCHRSYRRQTRHFCCSDSRRPRACMGPFSCECVMRQLRRQRRLEVDARCFTESRAICPALDVVYCFEPKPYLRARF